MPTDPTHRPPPDGALSAVLTTGQAVDRYGRAAVRRHLRAGRWVTTGRHVVVLHNGPRWTDPSPESW